MACPPAGALRQRVLLAGPAWLAVGRGGLVGQDRGQVGVGEPARRGGLTQRAVHRGGIRELADSELTILADKGYAGAGEHIRTPYKGRNKPASQKDANRAHARLRGPGERANAQLKSWRILRKHRCCPWRAGQLAKAIHVLQTLETGG